MRSTNWKELMCLSVLLLLALTPVVSRADVLWTAYNDCHTNPVRDTADNVTWYTLHDFDEEGFTIRPATGSLKDFATGSDVGMPTVTFTATGTVGTSDSGSAGGTPQSGTDAYNYFFDGSGTEIADLYGNLMDVQGSVTQTITFTGLNPTYSYKFIGTSIRDEVNNDRITLVTISGHDSATASSSTGITTPTPATAHLQAGDNRSDGYVVGWTDIACGSDGSFAITSACAPGSTKVYSVAVFMLEATGTLGNQPPNVNAGVDQQITLPVCSVTINDATVTDPDGLGDPNGYLDWQWSQVSGPKNVEFEPDVDELNPTVRFPLDGEGAYVLRLDATDGALPNSDEITITVQPSTCPVGDVDGNCRVDHSDLYLLGLQWLSDPVGNADITGDGNVDNSDFKWLADSWRQNWQTGSLQVSIYPINARADGAQWRVDGGSWHNHDYVESGLPTGSHTVEFADIADWDKPIDQAVEVTEGAITPASGTYIEHTGSLRVNISPPDVLPTAKWRRVGETTWLDSGSTENDVPAGAQYVEFAIVADWISPGTVEVSIAKDTLETLNATYTELGDMTLMISEFMANKGSVFPTSHGSSFTTMVYGELERPDWIEIHNLDPSIPANLEGWYLTDDKDNLTKWKFPAGVTIVANEYLVVFASNKAELYCPGNYPFRDDYDYYHTNFQLDRDGEYLALVAPDGLTVAHEYDEYPKQRGYISYGYSSSGQEYGYFTTPTAEEQNASTCITNVVADTAFSVDRGFYVDPIDVVISSATPDATIRYTKDGSEPTMSNGYTYSSPVGITTTTCLRAAAFKTDWLSTNVDTQTYIFLDDVVEQPEWPDGFDDTDTWGHDGADYEMDPEIVGAGPWTDLNGQSFTIEDALLAIPTVSLVMSEDDWFNPSTDPNVGGIYANLDWEDDGSPNWENIYGEEVDRGVSVEFIDPVSGDQFQQNSTVRIQGGSSTNGQVDKLSMRVKFREPFGPTKLKYPLFGEGATDTFDTIILEGRSNYSWNYDKGDEDHSQNRQAQYTRDQYVSDLHNAMGGYSPRGQHVHLYINGLYWGLYNIHERPDDSFAAELFGGNKREYHAVRKGTDFLNNGNSYDAETSYNQMLAAASDAENNPTNEAKWENIKERLDVENLIDYLMINWYVGNNDWGYNDNWYATGYGDPDHKSKWRYHSWDAEKCLNDPGSNDTDEHPGGDDDEATNLKYHPEYRMLFADHVHRHMKNGGVLTPEGAEALYQIRLDMVDRAVVGESARWGDNQWPDGYTRDGRWLEEKERLAGLLREPEPGTYFHERTNTVLGQLENMGIDTDTNPPEFYINGSPTYDSYVSLGDSLTMTKSGSGTIYYTLNGNDPRAFGGVVNTAGGSTAYSSAETIDKSVHVKARVLDGSEWSALSEAIYAIDTVAQKLRITELMYHPTDPTPAEKTAAGDPTLIDEDFEFIELKNIGVVPINLNLVHFTDGIDFTFGDYSLGVGQFAVIVKNQAAFQARYPGVSPSLIAGTYTGALNNGGEEIVMRDALGAEIHDFDFNDTWFVITDGGGYSLNKIDPDTASTTAPDSWDSQPGWRPSSVLNGTPAADDTGYTLQPEDVVISEVLTHTDDLVYGDWIEIWNRTGSPVNIGGWFLSDNELNLTKYEIATDDPRATILPYSYVVFDSVNDFRNPSDPGSHAQFGISEHGEDVYLTSGAGGVLTGEYSTEQENFGAAENGVTLGMYIKSDASDDFVRLQTVTKGSANNNDPIIGPVVISEIMYNPLDPDADAEFIELTNLTGGTVDLYDTANPTNTWQIKGVNYAFPTGVTLSANETILVIRGDPATFRTTYGIPCGIDIYGYPGALDNGGEKVTLIQPGTPDPITFEVPEIRIDRVNYDDSWYPSTDGLGDSLTRSVLGDYGNDSDNWEAATPSPGS